MRLGLFGGSFDPVHLGHLRLAECCREQARLDAVWFVPAAVQPFKQHGPRASDADRVAMLHLAVAGREGLEVSTLEIDRGGVSYTADTLRAVRAERPDAELFFLMGADTLRELPGWREPEAILRLAIPLVVQRPGEPELEDAPPHQRVEMPPMDISSSAIRAAIAARDAVAEWVPAAVSEYVRAHRLYQ